MKKFIAAISLCLASLFLTSLTAYAKVGDMGFFGGISEGRMLPKTTEILLEQSTSARKKTETTNLVYKEVIFLNGTPVEFEGLLVIKPSGSEDSTIGTYAVNYEVKNSDTTNPDNRIARKINFTVNYRKEGNQTIRDYKIKSWSETVTIGGTNYVLDPKQSSYGVSIIEDQTPGVTYYKGDISQRAVYTQPGAEEAAAIVHDSSGSFYGYNCAWSSAETQRIDATVTTDDWQMQYQIRPSVSVSKLIQYSQNEPTAISFSGNYKEVMQKSSGLQYDIFSKPRHLYEVEPTGGTIIESFNDFEQLIAPDVSYLKGHPAEDDIKKLFGMEVLTGEPKFYLPDQSITRGQYVTALAKAIKLQIADPNAETSNKRKQTIKIVFPDILPEIPEYPYLIAAYKANIAIGRDNGNFYKDAPIERQEAIAVLLRSLGLENLGLDPTPMTPFTDDYKVSQWAKSELYAAERIGLIYANEDGDINPKAYVSKAEAAALINRLITYMRTDLKTDYTEHIVDYTN